MVRVVPAQNGARVVVLVMKRLLGWSSTQKIKTGRMVFYQLDREIFGGRVSI